VLAAWFDALEFVETNPEEAFSIMAEASDVSVEQMKAMWSGVRMYDRDDVVRIMGTPGDPGPYYETVSDMSEFMIGQELIPKPVAASDVIDASFVRDGMGSN
jgi:NitT/TauT family transport system substrate-binding protein